MNPKLTTDRINRKGIVYIRQSSPGQVTNNQESQRRQYGLADRARELGFRDVEVIDEDLGRSGSGLVERPGFQRLVAQVCAGAVGAVFCIEASRLARNGRDWHHLIELCRLVDSLIIDPDGVYDPRLLNDRLLLGLKGTMSEFELNLLRQRSEEAIWQKASRGELRFCVPVGYLWTTTGKLEMDPDLRVQQALKLVFSKMVELGSVRQVLLWYRSERICLPARVLDEPGGRTVWRLPVYGTILKLLTNPFYAGAYVFGRTEGRTTVIDGRARKTSGHRKPQEKWAVLIKDHHAGYISWAEYERNQVVISANTHMKSVREHKSGRGGRALLAGLLRCRRCGRMLHVAYSPARSSVSRYNLRYHCRGAHINHGESWCISFGGLRVDEAVADEILQVIGGDVIEAALEAASRRAEQYAQHREALVLEIEQARYEGRLAAKRYDAVDPENRLVAAELEARWNLALKKLRELEDNLERFEQQKAPISVPPKEVLLSLAADLPVVWNSSSTDMRLKQRIVRILINEIISDVDESSSEIVLIIHWAGGRHSELRVRKNKTGQHRYCTKMEVIEVIRQMSAHFNDEQIAATLNRLGLRTGAGNSWNKIRVYSARQHHQLPANDKSEIMPGVITLEEAAKQLGVSPTTVRRLIARKLIEASQVVAGAPWQIPAKKLESEAVRKAARDIKNRVRLPRTLADEGQPLLFSEG